MDIYHIWCNLKPGVNDVEFCERVDTYMGYLKGEGKIVGHRITRRKLGLGPSEMLEFHIMLETENLAQLDAAFQHVSGRADPVESFHHAVNSQVADVKFALYRDFPDPQRKTGEEKF